MDALACRADEGRDHATIRLGELRVSNDPRDSEWGNPAEANLRHGMLNKIGMREASGGIEPS